MLSQTGVSTLTHGHTPPTPRPSRTALLSRLSALGPNSLMAPRGLGSPHGPPHSGPLSSWCPTKPPPLAFAFYSFSGHTSRGHPLFSLLTQATFHLVLSSVLELHFNCPLFTISMGLKYQEEPDGIFVSVTVLNPLRTGTEGTDRGRVPHRLQPWLWAWLCAPL